MSDIPSDIICPSVWLRDTGDAVLLLLPKPLFFFFQKACKVCQQVITKEELLNKEAPRAIGVICLPYDKINVIQASLCRLWHEWDRHLFDSWSNRRGCIRVQTKQCDRMQRFSFESNGWGGERGLPDRQARLRFKPVTYLRVWPNGSLEIHSRHFWVSSQQWGNRALLVFLSLLLLRICVLFAYLFSMIAIRSPSFLPPYQGRVIFTEVHPSAAFCFPSAVDGKRIWCSWMVPAACQEKELRSLKVYPVIHSSGGESDFCRLLRAFPGCVTPASPGSSRDLIACLYHLRPGHEKPVRTEEPRARSLLCSPANVWWLQIICSACCLMRITTSALWKGHENLHGEALGIFTVHPGIHTIES